MAEKRRKGVSKTGNTYRVQRTVAGTTVRASFTDLKTANDFSKAVDENARAGLPPPSPQARRFHSAPTTARVLLRDWVEYSIEISQKKTQSSLRNAARNRRRYELDAEPFFGSIAAIDVTSTLVCAYRDELADVHNLARTTAKARLGVVRRGLEEAKKAGVIPGNPADDVRARDPQRPRRPAPWAKTRRLTPYEVRALAREMPTQLQLLVWLMFGMCLRISEAFGVRLRHWDAASATLRVRRQGGTRKEGSDENEKTKTPAGTRVLPVPALLVPLICEYIERFHPPRPHEGPELEAWLNRRLIVSPQSDEPWRVVVDRRWSSALQATGLDFDSVGFYVNPHLLRKSGSTAIGNSSKVPGSVWSAYLGHKTKGKDGASRTTYETYFFVEDKRLVKCAKALNKNLKKLGNLAFEDPDGDHDMVTVHDAAALLGVSPQTISRRIADGTLVAVSDPDWSVLPDIRRRSRWGPRLLLRTGDVFALADQLRSDAERWCSMAEAARRLGVPRYSVMRLIEKGLLIEKATEKGARMIEADSVERVDGLITEERAAGHLSLRETTRLLGLSESGVRSLVVTGRLEKVQPVAGDSPLFMKISVHRELTARGK